MDHVDLFYMLPLEITWKILNMLSEEKNILKVRLLDKHLCFVATQLMVEYQLASLRKESLLLSAKEEKELSFQMQFIAKRFNEKKEARQALQRSISVPPSVLRLLESVCQFEGEMRYLAKLRKDLHFSPKVIYVPMPVASPRPSSLPSKHCLSYLAKIMKDLRE
jgi:hypothetical protein